MPKKTKMTQEDRDAFAQAMKGVKPLVQQKKQKIRLKFTPKKQQTRARQEDKDSFLSHEHDDLETVVAEEFIAYKQPAISDKTLRKLRKGQYNVEAKLDLHGLSVEEAREAVNHFLQDSLAAKHRVVLIVHGKGHHSQMPILKNKLNHWLRSVNVILAFCSASQAHGSRGAIYILLKRGEELE